MNKKIKLVSIFTAMIVLAAAGTWAQTSAKPVIPPDSEFDFELIRDDTALRVRHYKGTAKSIQIPSTIQGFPVKEVCELWNDSVTNLVIPEGVEKIWELGVKNISSVTLPSTLFIIGKNSFNFDDFVGKRGEDKLTSITIPKNVKVIEAYAFFCRSNLTSVNFSEGLVIIGSGAFTDTGIKSVTFPSSLRVVKHDAFLNCKNLDEVNVPEGYKIFWKPWSDSVEPVALNAFSYESVDKRTFNDYSRDQSAVDYKLALKVRLKHLPSTITSREAYSIWKEARDAVGGKDEWGF